jgi:hypothetical protein
MSAGQEWSGADQSTISRRLLELSQVQRWVYHVGDLGTGELTTTELDGPLTPRTRAAALSPFAPPPGITLGGPSYRLTPRASYQASPEASTIASFLNDFDSGNDLIGWEFPRSGAGQPAGGIVWSFAVAPEANQALVSVSVSAVAYEGEVGQVVVEVQEAGMTKVPITDTPASHTIDLTFSPLAGRPMAVNMGFESGLGGLTFSEIFFGPVPLVVEPIEQI